MNAIRYLLKLEGVTPIYVNPSSLHDTFFIHLQYLAIPDTYDYETRVRVFFKKLLISSSRVTNCLRSM